MSLSFIAGARRAGRLARDPVLLALAAAGVALAVLLGGAGTFGLRLAVFWGAQASADLLTAFLAHRVTRVPGLPPAARRFWGALRLAALLFLTSDGTKTVVAVRDPVPANLQFAGAEPLGYTAGIVLLLVVMAALPVGPRSPRERARLWLDASTLLVAVAAFAWCLLIGPALAADQRHLWENLLSSALAVLTGFAVVKLVLTGAAPWSRAAAVPALVALALQAVGDVLASGAGEAAVSGGQLVARGLPALFIASAARIQALELHGGWERRPGRRSTRVSLLPYGSIAATFALLIGVLLPRGLDPTVAGAVAGLGVIVLLVVVRQVNALADNAALVRQLAYQASHDPLTGLANRTEFEARLDAALSAGPAAVVLVDLDEFKAVNDTLGHEAGDRVLLVVAERLRDSVRPQDTVARLGGDEFAVVLPGVGEAAAITAVQRFRQRLAEPLAHAGELLTPRASIGIAVGEHLPAQELLRRADATMYAVKQRGKDDFRVAR